jgi:hypothetical protein
MERAVKADGSIAFVPYQIAFTKKLHIADKSQYMGPACYGGDLVAQHLLPFIRANYPGVLLSQEKWGWHIFFNDDGAVISIQIYCDDSNTGAFRVVILSRIRKMMFFKKVSDVPELKYLMGLLVPLLEEWAAEPCIITELTSVEV